MPRLLTVLLSFGVAVAWLVAPVAATWAHDSPTFGYNYQRTRRFSAATIASSVMPSIPWTVPLSGESNSTPVEYGNELYQFTYYGGGNRFRLWSVNISGPKPGTAVQVFPAASGTYVEALANYHESFGRHQTAGLAVSATGAYLAVAAGIRLFWWPITHPGEVKTVLMRGPNQGVEAMSSGDPVFVPVPHSIDPSGLAVCGDDWDGSLWCFGVTTGTVIGGFARPPARYFPTLDHPHDTWASMTASPTLVPGPAAPGGHPEVCAGVSGTAHGRVACIHPDGSLYPDGKSYFVMADGSVYHPGGIAASAAYAAGRLIAQGVYGGLYEIDTRTGRVVARTDVLAEVPEVDIAAPALVLAGDPNLVVGVADGWSDACLVDLRTARVHGCLSSPTASAPRPTNGTVVTPATVIQEGASPHAWLAESSRIVDVDMAGGSLEQSVAEGKVANPWATLVADVGSHHAFALWGDDATAFWCAKGAGARVVGHGCQGAGPGGLQIWYATAPLTAWFESNPAVATAAGGVPPGGECLLALTTPGAFGALSATLPDGLRVGLRTDGAAAGDIARRSGPLFDSVAPPGCPPPQTTADDWESLQAQWSASGPAGAYPGMVDRRGTAPGRFGRYQLWWAAGVGVPARAGRWRASLGGTTTGGTALSVGPALYVTCAAGDRVGAGGRCLPPPTGPPGHAPPAPSSSSWPPCGWQSACPPKARGPWVPILICAGPIECSTDFPHSRLPGQFIPEPCDPNAPGGDPNRCPGPPLNP